MKLCLQVLGQSREGSFFEHGGPTIHIGRDPQAELAFPDNAMQQVSWKHARIDLAPDGARLSDLKSTNGTYCNGKRLAQTIVLQVGDQVRLGQTGPVLKVVALDLSEERPVSRPPRGRNVSRMTLLTSMTRRLVASLQNQQRKVLMYGGLAVLVLAGAIAGGFWHFQKRTTPPGEEVYRKVLPATVWVLVPPPQANPTRQERGTGVLIETNGRRLVLTAYHVVKEAPEAYLFFPVFDEKNEVVAAKDFYIAEADKYGYLAKVVGKDPDRDLALLELQKTPPANARALQLAKHSPEPGTVLHAIGTSNPLWSKAAGEVQQTVTDGARDDEHRLPVRMIWLKIPMRRGDSGGPVVNHHGELAGIISNQPSKSGSDEADQGHTRCIDVQEIRTFLSNTQPAGSPST
jgi:pSer/pThr/pTyr-binding forkhead associated (FHA) protein